ncbi:hypothetical protein [Candidatus Kryptobacter tengchongensis]|uniref:hypothetical protein n=1 Tax=Kryptobacter tengchongensis TaxID=1643429 RepID=UPI000707A4E0|nr:hypothetical protein [Candidatus Kryptobacter tengchongensis]CUS80631.1 hypothetical protein JGI20_00073 [Candidatus Kryptobacter tengchongensis]
MKLAILILVILFSFSTLDAQVREKFKGEYKGKEKKEETTQAEEKKAEQPATTKSETSGIVIFSDNFTGYNEGETPSKWEVEIGSAEVVTYKGKRWMKIFSSEFKAKPAIETLPQNYRLEFDVILGYSTVTILFATAYGKELNQVEIEYHRVKSERVSTSLNLDINATNKVIIEVKGNSLKCLINGKTAILEARAFDEPANIIKVITRYSSLDRPVYISNFAIYDLTK